MTRAQLQAAVFAALDNADLNGNCPCNVSVGVVAVDLLDHCSDIEGISERRVRPAIYAWKTSRCAVFDAMTPEEQRRVDLKYQGAQL